MAAGLAAASNVNNKGRRASLRRDFNSSSQRHALTGPRASITICDALTVGSNDSEKSDDATWRRISPALKR